MSFRAMFAIAIIFAAATFAAIDQYQKYNDFVVTDSRVTSVEEQCYLEKVDHFLVSKRTSTSGLMKCPTAELLMNAHPAWQGYTIYRKIMISSSYTSPVDHQPHISTIQYSEYPGGRELRAGEKLTIRASKSLSSQTRAL